MPNYSEKIHALSTEIPGAISVLLVDAESGMLISSIGSKVNPEVIGAGMSAFASAFNAVPVSYTHLDVYKRQSSWVPMFVAVCLVAVNMRMLSLIHI